jgi:hypothetical protein
VLLLVIQKKILRKPTKLEKNNRHSKCKKGSFSSIFFKGGTKIKQSILFDSTFFNGRFSKCGIFGSTFFKGGFFKGGLT